MAKIKSKEDSRNKISLTKRFNIIDYPLFCFKHLNCKPKGDYKFYANFIVRLSKLSNISWNVIEKSPRHGFGTEKIPISNIKPKLPNFITPDVKNLLVFRASGDNRPFIGLRDGNVFHIIFIEEKFGDVYDH